MLVCVSSTNLFHQQNLQLLTIDFFRLKTTVLAEKLFRPADQRSTADSTLWHMLSLVYLGLGPDRSFFFKVSTGKRPRFVHHVTFYLPKLHFDT